jgi:hypothetical protein
VFKTTTTTNQIRKQEIVTDEEEEDEEEGRGGEERRTLEILCIDLLSPLAILSVLTNHFLSHFSLDP